MYSKAIDFYKKCNFDKSQQVSLTAISMNYSSNTDLYVIDKLTNKKEDNYNEAFSQISHIKDIPEFKLDIINGEKHSSYILNRNIYTVGRDDMHQININNRFVSSHHAILTRVKSNSTRSGYSYFLQDGTSESTRSTNGVYINGKRVFSQCLEEGDEIGFGANVRAYFSEVISVKGYQKIEKTVQNLEIKLQSRENLLKSAFDFEKRLRKVSKSIRDCMDEKDILKVAVEELSTGLGIKSCNASLFDFDEGTSTVYAEYSTFGKSKRRISLIKDHPEIYQPLLNGVCFQFCSLIPNKIRGRVSLLACPIMDDEGIIGDLWLVNHHNYVFTEKDIIIVNKVANQCAITIRQSRLFREIQLRLEKLEEINLLKDEFLSTVSHELRTPMTNMKMALNLLANSLDLGHLLSDSENSPIDELTLTERYLKIASNECKREIALIEDLLSLQKIDKNHYNIIAEEVDLHNLFSSFLDIFKERAGSLGQNLIVDIDSELPPLNSDASILERVITELLNNACKYTNCGENITLSACLINRSEIQIRVSNTGIEIPSEELSKIFDKFYRLPSSYLSQQSGTGLGLSLVKGLVESLGGTIVVSSSNMITSFTVTLSLLSSNFQN